MHTSIQCTFTKVTNQTDYSQDANQSMLFLTSIYRTDSNIYNKNWTQYSLITWNFTIATQEN